MLRQTRTEGFELGPTLIRSNRPVEGLLRQILAYDGVERRINPRFNVDWRGMLYCRFSDIRAAIEVGVLNISEGGCCIHLATLSAGSHNLAEPGSEDRLELTLFLRQVISRIEVKFRWYMPISEGVYGAGLEFVSMTKGNRSLLLAALRRLS